MLRHIKITTFFFVISINAFTMPKVIFKKNDYRIEKKVKGNFELTSFVYKGKEIKQWKRNALMNALTQVNFVKTKNLILLRWPKGVHGEEISVIDLKKRQEVWNNRSSWPYSVENINDQIRINYTLDADDKGNFETLSKFF